MKKTEVENLVALSRQDKQVAKYRGSFLSVTVMCFSSDGYVTIKNKDLSFSLDFLYVVIHYLQ
jgi:hypothetical protein